MKKTKITKILSVLLCFALIAATALFITGCDKNTENAVATQTGTITADTQPLGTGNTSFGLKVVGLKERTARLYEIHTDKTTVGDALLELGLIEGDEGPYGLYVKTVCGETVDYDTDGKYWAFYVNGEYAMNGVEATDIVPDTEYSFIAE